MNQRLEVDRSIIENNLLLPNLRSENDGLLSLFPNLAKDQETDDIPWIPVKPNPGFCVKCRTIEEDKVFINVCHTSAIPEPPDISDEKLIEILESEDPQNFRIPMSIGYLHIEADKSGNPCSVYDIAVNSTFYVKLKTNEVFKHFFMSLCLEALENKFSLKFDMQSQKTYVILKNRTVLGTLQIHRLQQRPIKKTPTPLIVEISSNNDTSVNLNVKDNQEKNLGDGLLQIVKHPPHSPKFLIATIKSDVSSGSDLMLHVGEDRILVSHRKKHKTLVDTFIEYLVDVENTEAIYDVDLQVLKIKLPLLKTT